ncbi:hypothetical protein EVA_04104 [gut metagenome]|uniref:Uncharacterized protein n=1 Tax=gut metagenome TaxID=749906 RepID=J9GJC6_9ZZZZ
MTPHLMFKKVFRCARKSVFARRKHHHFKILICLNQSARQTHRMSRIYRLVQSPGKQQQPMFIIAYEFLIRTNAHAILIFFCFLPICRFHLLYPFINSIMNFHKTFVVNAVIMIACRRHSS